MVKTTDITMIVDRSGSMGNLQEQVIKSYNEFLNEQKSVEGKARVTLIQFDDQYEVNYEGIDIAEAKELNAQTYEPRGMTALNDAIGRTIVCMKTRLKDSADSVIVVITTDGLENASSEFSAKQIKKMIKECEDVLGWKFIYLAADDASFDEHARMGMNEGRSFKTGRGRKGYGNASSILSAKLGLYRISGCEEDLDFTPKERRDAEDLGDS